MARDASFVRSERPDSVAGRDLAAQIALLEIAARRRPARASAVTTTLLRRLPLLAAVRLPSAPTRWAMSEAKRPRHDDTLGDEMKRYEDETCASVVDVTRPVVIRLDGHCFHTYTKGFARPYDTRIHAAMVATATDLLERFSGCLTAYTESDEISLVFPPSAEENCVLPFSGRVQKLTSVTAGFASARFNLHMIGQPFGADAAEQSLRERVLKSEAHFDARVFALPGAERLAAYVRWRALQDCRRNSISMLAQSHFPPSRLHGVDSRSMLRLLADEKGVRWEETPPFFRYGTFVKKEQYDKEGFDPKAQKAVVATRTRAVARSFEFDADDAGFLLARFWAPEAAGAAES